MMGGKPFNIDSTNACKGVALILLLWHHLFFSFPEYGFFVVNTAKLSKVCVAIFVLLSGFGFSESIKHKRAGMFHFYKKRLVKLYSNYWFIALIFVFIGTFWMGRQLEDAFDSHIYTKFVIQMLGLHRFAYGEYGYNATWWYMSVIVPLIILFPFIYVLTKKFGLFFLFLFLLLLIPEKQIIPVLNTWLLPFGLGIYASQRNLISKIDFKLEKYRSWKYLMLLTAVCLVVAFRSFSPYMRGTEIDWLFGGLIILFVFELINTFGMLEKFLSFLGKHLFNIFLFHTFIYYYFWSEFIYSFHYPVFIFLALLSICVLISMGIDQVKKRIYLNRLVYFIEEHRLCPKMDLLFQKNIEKSDNSQRYKWIENR